MPPAGRRAPAADPAPSLAAAWRTFTDAVLALPEETLRSSDAGCRPIGSVAAAVLVDVLDSCVDLRNPAPPAGAARTLAGYLEAVRSLRPAEASEPSPLELKQRLSAAVDQAGELLLLEGPVAGGGPAVVSSAGGPVVRAVYVQFRLITALAAGRDLPEPLVPERVALRLCVRELARALADIAPGRSVELRVPPYVAVQCVEGPRHTRGTPPNVVEVEPLTFLELATGRENWTTAVKTGRIRASGERADLRNWLPLVGGLGTGTGGQENL